MPHFTFVCLLAIASCFGILNNANAQNGGFLTGEPIAGSVNTGQSFEFAESVGQLQSNNISNSVSQGDVFYGQPRNRRGRGRRGRNRPVDFSSDSNWYFSVAGGANWMLGSDTGGIVSAAIGRSFRNRLRWNLEFVHRSNEDTAVFGDDIVTSEYELGLDSNSIMTNVFYDWNLGRRVKYYAGAGIGISFIDLDTRISQTYFGPSDPNAFGFTTEPIRREFSFSEDDTVFAYQFTAGVSALMTQRACLLYTSDAADE